jgi:hypothetical protein
VDSRSVPELVMTDQTALKHLSDSFNDNVQLSTLPPFEVPRSRAKARLVIGPLRQIKVDRKGEIAPMQMPSYPVGNDKQQAEVWKRVNNYFGRMAEEVPPLLTQLHQQGAVDDFIDNLLEAVDQTLALCQQFMTDEELQLVTGAQEPVPVARTVEEIQGRYNVQLEFNVALMDMALVKEMAAVIGELILPMDTLSTVQRDVLVQWLFSALNPNLAEAAIRPRENATQKEIDDEQSNFAKIAAGVEPQMVPEGQNYQLRLQVVEEILQRNPEAAEKLTPMSRKILEARVKHLRQQVEQTQINPIRGRALGKQVLGE